MMIVCYSHFTKPFSEGIFKEYLTLLPADSQTEIVKYKRWQDRQARLIGRLLLLQGLNKFGLKTPTLADIKFNDYKRPYFEGSLDFNISHSGEYVICALSNAGKVGVDIEKIKLINFNSFKHILSPEEQKTLSTAEDKYSLFYSIWTKKEAAIKADGRGLYVPVKNIKIKPNKAIIEKQPWFLKELKIADDYVACLASEIKISEEVSMMKIEF